MKRNGDAKSIGESELIDIKELGHILHRDPRSLYRDLLKGYIPPSVTIGRSRRWVRRRILKWIDEGCPPQA
jgi:predicted DNA-binding transcriptional regulator AlpA